MIVEEKIDKMIYIYEVTGKIVEVVSPDEYKFTYNGEELMAKSISGDTYLVNDIVHILVLNNDFSRRIILCKKP